MAVKRQLLCMLILISAAWISLCSRAEVVSWVDTSLETYGKVTLVYGGKPYFYNGVQIRREKLRDVWQFTDNQLRALYDIAKADGFNTVGLPIWWNEVQPDQMYTPVEAVTKVGDGSEIDTGEVLELQHGASPSDQKHVVLEYDYSGLSGNIAAAMIRVYVQNISSGPGVVEVYGTGATNVLLDTVDVGEAHFFDLDVTEFIQQNAGSGLAAFELRVPDGSGAVLEIDRMPSAEADGVDYVDYTTSFQGISGVRYPPTLRISRDDVYDWDVIEQMIQDMEDASLKLEILWFGSDTTNLSMDDRLPYYVQRNYRKARYDDGSLLLKKNDARYWKSYGVYTFYMDKLDPFLRDREKSVIRAMFDHIAVYNAAHGDRKTVVGCQVNNESNIWTRRFGFSDRYRSIYSDARWEEGNYSSVYRFMMDIRAEWLSHLAGGVKESEYSVWTRQNNAEFLANGEDISADTVPENELLRKTTGTHMDFFGIDVYRYSELDKLYAYLTGAYSHGKNFPMIMETDWTLTGESSGSPVRIPDYGIMMTYAANGAHHLYDILGPDGHDFYIRGPNNTAIPGDTVAGANTNWNTQTRETNQMLQKIGHDLASRRAGGSELLFFNPFAETSAQVQQRLDGYPVEYDTDTRGVGIAIRRGTNEFVLASKTTSTFKLPSELQVQSASVGYYDASNQWVSEGAKAFSLVDGKYVFEMNDYEVVQIQADPSPAAAGPLSRYSFETNTLDVAGVNDGTAVGSGLSYADHALAGQAYALSGDGSGHLALPLQTAYPRSGPGNALGSFTYSLWVKRAAFSGKRYVMGSYNDGGNSCMQIDIRDTGATEIYFREDGGGSLTLRSPEGLIAPDQWHLLGFTYDGFNLRIYVDGIQRASTVGTLSSFSAWQYPMVLLGRNVRGTVDGLFEGQVDDLKVYDYAFTPEEFARQWYGYTGESRAVATYQAEEAIYGGGTEFDDADSGYHGTGYINMPGSGGVVEFTGIDGGSGGMASLEIRYALGAADRTGLLIVNGVTNAITAAGTGDWARYAIHHLDVPLNSGTNNFIRIESNGQDWGNVDELVVAVNVPVAPVIEMFSVTPGTVSLSWASESGRNYSILSTTNLLAGPWTTNLTVSGDGSMISTNIATGIHDAEYFRLRH